MEVRWKVNSFAMEGRTDGKNLRAISTNLAPRRVILVHGIPESYADLSRYAAKMLGGSMQVWTPGGGSSTTPMALPPAAADAAEGDNEAAAAGAAAAVAEAEAAMMVQLQFDSKVLDVGLEEDWTDTEAQWESAAPPLTFKEWGTTAWPWSTRWPRSKAWTPMGCPWCGASGPWPWPVRGTAAARARGRQQRRHPRGAATRPFCPRTGTCCSPRRRNGDRCGKSCRRRGSTRSSRSAPRGLLRLHHCGRLGQPGHARGPAERDVLSGAGRHLFAGLWHSRVGIEERTAKAKQCSWINGGCCALFFVFSFLCEEENVQRTQLTQGFAQLQVRNCQN